MKKLWMTVATISLITLCACGKDDDRDSRLKEDGMVGTTCYARPVVKNSDGRNVCITPASNWPGLSNGEFWYSITTAFVAKSATIEACKDANALDYGVKWGKSCYKACEEASVTSCIPFTPNPDV